MNKESERAFNDRDLAALASRWLTAELAKEAGLYRVSSADGAALVGRPVLGRDEGADVVIEVPVQLRQGAEAEVEDCVDLPREDPRVDAVLPRAVAGAVVRERRVAGQTVQVVTVEAREHDRRAHSVEAVAMCGDDDAGHAVALAWVREDPPRQIGRAHV